MSSFTGKTILITGGASGIGKIMGRMVLDRGAAHLVIWDLDKDALDRTAEELSSQGRVSSFKVDVSSLKDIQSAAAEMEKRHLQVDVLVNNAGVVVGTEFWNHSPEDIQWTMKVNTLAPMHITQCFLPQMMEKKGGHIVNISSAAGMVANPRMSVYVASKWALLGWSESLRIELEKMHPEVKVTAVTPSYISTGMFSGVKTHWISPIVTPEKAALKIIRGVEKNRMVVRMPWSVYLIPFMKGVLPLRWFDAIAGKWLKVYKSMDTFKGRKPQNNNTKK
nr:SDR family oxidoreductase [Saprospiraceae bacterium]